MVIMMMMVIGSTVNVLMKINEIIANAVYQGRETEQIICGIYIDTEHCPKTMNISNPSYCDNECQKCIESENKS